jgi:hypothetical protein
MKYFIPASYEYSEFLSVAITYKQKLCNSKHKKKLIKSTEKQRQLKPKTAKIIMRSYSKAKTKRNFRNRLLIVIIITEEINRTNKKKLTKTILKVEKQGEKAHNNSELFTTKNDITKGVKEDIAPNNIGKEKILDLENSTAKGT